ncbi:hypothetical protein ALI22I_09610 [Saccharothrix sp. ALI-22-I]|uniref:hypothetical protein n=1 Tax=Saccharothrix sp. ALI-22-I TaxID=1933778 RepID=UPI00097C60A8|nr:hypothetical protein [Saccharothrix sp. ALI-22-I]ONI91305.1 hypothetical protein ALI22I_09610 [Saccharothrix sp. ALI-22-I]
MCEDVLSAGQRSESWQPGDPFPLLPGPPVARYRKHLGLGGDEGWPVVTRQPRVGLVLSVGEAGRAAGRLLAAASDRPHEHLSLDQVTARLLRLGDVPAALVGLADDFADLADWPGRLAPRVGLIVARDATALLCLVYRTLTVDAVGDNGTFVATHPTQVDAPTADALGLDDLDVLRHRGTGTLVLRSFGRECCVNFPDGVICGRSGPTPPLVDTRTRVPSCLRGEGCYRPDLDESQRLPAAEVNASLVFMQACSTVAVGNNAFPTSVGVGLGFLDGTAVAVIGAVGLHVEDVTLRAVFEEEVSRGAPLGEVLDTLNRRADELHGEMSRFGLLGDPGLIMAPTQVVSTASTPVQTDPALLDQVVRWNDVVLPRLRSLRWLNVDLDETALADVAAHIRAVGPDLFKSVPAAEVRALADEVDRLQAGVVARTVARVHGDWWQFTAGGLAALRQESAEACACPRCGVDRAVRLRLRHRVHRDLVLRVVQCRHCGDVEQSTADAPTARTGVVWARRSEPAVVGAHVVNSGAAALNGAIGFAFVAGGHTGLPQGSHRALRVPAGEEIRVEWPVDLSTSTATADEHEFVCLSLHDGALSVVSGLLCLLGT